MKKNIRVLVMDDDKSTCEVLGEILTNLGYETRFANDGNEALKIYTEALENDNKFNIVIMDLKVKEGMSGEDSAKKILSYDPDAKLIISSGYYNNNIIHNYEQYGFCSVLMKPYKVNELKMRLEQFLDKSS